MLCFWGMQRLFCSLIYHSQDLPILFLTKENYDSSCHGQTSHVSFLSSQVSHQLYLIIEFHELLRNGAKESGNREQHWILSLCEVRDRSGVGGGPSGLPAKQKHFSKTAACCFRTANACNSPIPEPKTNVY